jgi:hypothetical protein
VTFLRQEFQKRLKDRSAQMAYSLDPNDPKQRQFMARCESWILNSFAPPQAADAAAAWAR